MRLGRIVHDLSPFLCSFPFFDISFSPSSLSLILYPFCSHLYDPRHDFLSVPRMARFVKVNLDGSTLGRHLCCFATEKSSSNSHILLGELRSIVRLAAIRMFPFLQLEPRRQKTKIRIDTHPTRAVVFYVISLDTPESMAAGKCRIFY